MNYSKYNAKIAYAEDFSEYKRGDIVYAVDDLHEDGENVTKGETDMVESVSSDHHGGLQLNLVRHGRGWSNHIWRKWIFTDG